MRKYFIVDKDEVFLGSQNFDWRALDQIHELGIRIKNREFARVYRRIFQYNWKRANGEDAAFIPTGMLRHPIIHIEGKDTLILYPTASPKGYIPYEAYWDETEIVRIIDSAKQEVVLQFLSYKTDENFSMALDSAIFRAASRNVKVKLIVSDWSIGKPAIDYLKVMSSLPNIEIRYTSIPELPNEYIAYARVEHCKFVSVDNKYCWLGTSNAEKSYFYKSRNVGVVIENAKVASRVHDIFMKSGDSDYTHLVVPEGEYIPREHGEK